MSASNRGSAQSNAELAAARRAEMAAACAVLQVSRHEVWNYPDGALMETNLRELAMRLVERMRTLRPHVVLTYGGGPPVIDAYEGFGARLCRPVYNALDPATHHRVEADPRFEGERTEQLCRGAA